MLTQLERQRGGGKVKALHPDVVTLDVEMPVMDGMDALKLIMEECPVPVLMLSSLTKEGADATIRSLELGAIDFITKPTSIFKVNTDDVKKKLHEKIKIVRKARLRSMKARPRPAPQPAPVKKPAETKITPREVESTGKVKNYCHRHIHWRTTSASISDTTASWEPRCQRCCRSAYAGRFHKITG